MTSTILIVDDDPNARLLVATILASGGMRVVEAATAADALLQVRREQPDAVLLDLGLPDVDGAALLRTLRSDPALRVPLVALYTASDTTTAAMRDFCAIYGVAGVIPKPCPPQRLLADVVALLRHAGES